MNPQSEIKSNFNNDIFSNSYKLTPNEEKGFMFEGEISESLFSLHLDHDELPHLFRSDFKRNRNDSKQNKGVDFRLSVNGYDVMTEAKDWEHAYESWLDKVTDRFMGRNNYGDFNICVVKNIHGSGFFKYRHKLREDGIKLMSAYDFSWYIYKLMRRGCKIYVSYYSNTVSNHVKFRVRESSEKNKRYIRQFYIASDNSDNYKINDSVEDTIKTKLSSKFHRGEQIVNYNINN